MTVQTTATGPLAGLRVLDISTMLAGPYGATLLGDLGVFDSVEIATAPIDAERTGQPALLATRAARNGRPTITRAEGSRRF